jgi:hypothetical protein
VTEAPAIALVDCARRPLRLTSFACAKFWLSSNPVSPPAWEGRVACHGCPAGAARAGVKLDPAMALRERLAPICPRCRRASDRIIQGRLCIGCYNRHLEVIKGSNGKGGFPRRAAGRLHTFAVMAVEGGAVQRIQESLCCGPMELAFARARRTKNRDLAFGWAPPAEGLAA